ncbi:flagellar biosynthesis anti-sigma factor FlgM [Thermovibrio sp.]
MKIEGFSSELLKLASSNLKGAGGKGKRRALNPSLLEDGVSVEIREELLSAEPESVSREKVERLKEAIKSGNYQVDPHRISEAIIREILGY